MKIWDQVEFVAALDLSPDNVILTWLGMAVCHIYSFPFFALYPPNKNRSVGCGGRKGKSGIDGSESWKLGIGCFLHKVIPVSEEYILCLYNT